MPAFKWATASWRQHLEYEVFFFFFCPPPPALILLLTSLSCNSLPLASEPLLPFNTAGTGEIRSKEWPLMLKPQPGIFGPPGPARACLFGIFWQQEDESVLHSLSFLIYSMVEYSLDLQNINLSAIRTVRVLRPLKAINRVPSEGIFILFLFFLPCNPLCVLVL